MKISKPVGYVILVVGVLMVLWAIYHAISSDDSGKYLVSMIVGLIGAGIGAYGLYGIKK